jgi:hypothetical protein
MTPVVDSKERTDFSAFPREEKKEMRMSDYVDVAPSAADFTKKVLSPDIASIPREQVIKIQMAVLKNPEEKFPLAVELFKIKVAAFKAAGGSTEAFAQELSEWREKNLAAVVFANGILRPSTGEHKALKDEIMALYRCLCDLAEEQYKNKTINWPFTQIFDLEQQVGFEVNKHDLLILDFLRACSVFINDKNQNFEHLGSLYWDSLVPQLGKLLLYFDKEERSKDCKFLVDRYLLASLVGRYPLKIDDTDDMLQFTRLWPYFAKYLSPSKVGDLFDVLCRHWPQPQVWLFTVQYCCKAARIIADPKQAESYLDIANQIVEKMLSPSWFSKETEPVQLVRAQALQEIRNAKAEITKKSASQKP